MRVYSDGVETFIPTPQVKSNSPDFLGCGDARTGAASYCLAKGMDFVTAVEVGTRVSSLTGNYAGRSWTNPDCDQHFTAIMKDCAPISDLEHASP